MVRPWRLNECITRGQAAKLLDDSRAFDERGCVILLRKALISTSWSNLHAFVQQVKIETLQEQFLKHSDDSEAIASCTLYQ